MKTVFLKKYAYIDRHGQKIMTNLVSFLQYIFCLQRTEPLSENDTFTIFVNFLNIIVMKLVACAGTTLGLW